ncbi:MAG: N-acetyltransferase [Pseudomonadota bacterium]
MATVEIRPEVPSDHGAVHAINDAAFDDDGGVTRLVQDLRVQRTPLPTVSLVAVADQPVGHVMLSHAWLDAESRLIDVLVLSPLAVHPSTQNKGVGSRLIRASLDAAEALGAPLVFLEGSSAYYGRRGFEGAMDLGFRRPSLRIPERAFQVARLSRYDATMTGTLVYRDVHWRHGVGLYPAP